MGDHKKVCVLGAFAVGKTSLVRRYVESLFSDEYITSFGVKVEKKYVPVNNHNVKLLLWDLYGEDGTQELLSVYLKGMAGYLLVVDPTRKSTFASAMKLHDLVLETLGPKPYIVVFNKCDLQSQWTVDNEDFNCIRDSSVAVVETSAKLDIGIDLMFEKLATSLIDSEAI